MADVTPGAETSEGRLAASSSWWSTVLMVLGVITSIGSQVLPALGENSKLGIISGAVLAVAGIVAKALTSMGYSASRATVKAADSAAKGNG